MNYQRQTRDIKQVRHALLDTVTTLVRVMVFVILFSCSFTGTKASDVGSHPDWDATLTVNDQLVSFAVTVFVTALFCLAFAGFLRLPRLISWLLELWRKQNPSAGDIILQLNDIRDRARVSDDICFVCQDYGVVRHQLPCCNLGIHRNCLQHMFDHHQALFCPGCHNVNRFGTFVERVLNLVQPLLNQDPVQPQFNFDPAEGEILVEDDPAPAIEPEVVAVVQDDINLPLGAIHQGDDNAIVIEPDFLNVMQGMQLAALAIPVNPPGGPGGDDSDDDESDDDSEDGDVLPAHNWPHGNPNRPWHVYEAKVPDDQLIDGHQRRRLILAPGTWKWYTFPYLDFIGKWNNSMYSSEAGNYAEHFGIHAHQRDTMVLLPSVLVEELRAFWSHRIRDDDHKEFQVCVAKCRQLCSVTGLTARQQRDIMMYAPAIAYLTTWEEQQNVARVIHGSYLRTGFFTSIRKGRAFLQHNPWVTPVVTFFAVMFILLYPLTVVSWLVYCEHCVSAFVTWLVDIWSTPGLRQRSCLYLSHTRWLAFNELKEIISYGACRQ